MNILIRSAVFATALFAAGCATHQDVLLAKAAPPPVMTIAQVPADGNSAEMDGIVRTALVQNGFNVRAPLPPGTRKSGEVDAIISYVDVWRWDLVMYLQSVAIKIFDARSGDLLVTGDWKNSAFHGYQDEGRIVHELLTGMAAKLRAATPESMPRTEEADAVPGETADDTAP